MWCGDEPGLWGRRSVLVVPACSQRGSQEAMRLRRAQDLEPCQGRGPLADIPGFVLGPRGEGEPDSQQLSAVFVFCPSQKSRHPRKKPWDWNHQEQPTTEADPEGILLVALSGIDFKIPLDDYVTELIVKIENFSTELET